MNILKVQSHQTIKLCKHCFQRVGEDHLLSCPYEKPTESQDAEIGPPPEGDPPNGPHGG